MTDGKADGHWPGTDEISVVKEMLLRQDSKQWKECSEFVKRCVYAKAKNIPSTIQDEISQEVMYRVAKHLPDFEFHCSLKTWLNTIIGNCIIDAYRKQQKERQFHVPLSDLHNEGNREGEVASIIGETRSVEDSYEIKDELRHAWSALLEYTDAHANRDRNRLIIRMVLFEGHTHIEAAEAAGCKAPVASYVIREAQRYAREKMWDES
ncbi:MAG TPA: RNA polymerase sigma factor [Ktedonobacteraceae bacterium]|nr:RNA polymerase sigma factor [Ktedonobacteraceae bacterium]